MKLVQLNIWQGRLLHQIIAYLRRENPDILCLQEVYSSGLDTPLLPFFRSLEYIAQAFPGYHVFFSPTHSMPVAGEPVHMGNAILSRFPLGRTETIFVHGKFTEWSTLNEYRSNVRNLQYAEVVIRPRQTLSLFNHHGYWESNPVGSETTAKAMRLVADAVKQTTQPVILVGDFNITPESPAMRPIQDALRDLTKEHEINTTLSAFSHVKDPVACDHICVSSDLTVQSFAVSDALVSDHSALVLDFDTAAAAPKVATR